MPAAKSTLITYEGLKDLEKELSALKTAKRKEIAEKIKEAKGQGDLSENAEYDAAREEQALNEARIAKLEKTLKNAVVVDTDDIDKDSIGIGSKVMLYDSTFKENVEYSIVGSAEANPVSMRISNESPLGMALIGKKEGETVEVAAPDGVMKYKILSIA